MSKTEKKEDVVSEVSKTKEILEQVKKKELSREDKKALFRRINFDVEQSRIHIDEKYKRPGRVPRVVDDNPSRIQEMLQIGYEFVQDTSVQVGNESLDQVREAGSIVRIEVGGKNSPCRGILMDIDEDLLEVRREWKAKRNNELLEGKIEEGKTNRNKDQSLNDLV